MNANNFRYTSLLLVMLSASTSAYAGYGGTAPTDYTQYKVTGPGTLGVDTGNTVSLATILTGSATPPNTGAPTGNVELFATSDTLNNAQFNAYHGTTSIIGTLGAPTLTISSLNTDDWATVVSPGKTLLQSWMTNLLASTGLSASAAQQGILEGLFVNNNGEQRFSDPNIAYAYTEAGTIHLGLAGFNDAKPFLTGAVNSLLATDPTNLTFLGIKAALASLTAVPISELVKVSYNNAPAQYLYSFTPTVSGLTSNDSTESFTSVFDIKLNDPINASGQRISLLVDAVSVPEPSAIFLLGLGLFGLAFSRKK
jgi:hypothetical protein